MRSPEYPLIEKGADHHVNGDGPIVKAVSVMVARSIHAQRFVSAGDGDRDAAERQAWRHNFAKARQADLIGAETDKGLELVWLIAA
jgi:hypothetical protein